MGCSLPRKKYRTIFKKLNTKKQLHVKVLPQRKEKQEKQEELKFCLYLRG
jgi:hypothetical protein